MNKREIRYEKEEDTEENIILEYLIFHNGLQSATRGI